MRVWLGVAAAALVVWATGTASADGQVVGSVKIVQGTALVQRAGQSLPAREGLLLLEKDTLQTGPDGRLGVILRDDTRLSLGPDSEVHVDQFAFAPTEGRLALLLRMARGAVAYASGTIAHLSPNAVRFETPVGIVGVRGTRFAVALDRE